MRSISYKSALIGIFLVLSLVAIAGVMFNSQASTSDAILKLSNEIVQKLSRRIVQRATDRVSEVENFLYVNARIAANSGGIVASRELLSEVFWQQLMRSPAVRTVYVADRDGNLVMADQDPRTLTAVIDRSVSPVVERVTYRTPDFDAIAHVSKPSDYDPHTRPWFIDSESGRVRWSDVYRFAFSEGVEGTLARGITASLAVPDAQGERQYVVAVDVTLQGMSDFLSAQPISEAVAMFLADNQDRLVAYPYQLGLDAEYNTGNAPLPKVQALQQQWIQDAYAAYKNSGPRTDESLVTHTDGETYITHVRDFDPGIKSKLRLIMIAPKSYLMSSADTMLRESLVVSLIILLGSLLVIYWVASMLSEPILQLAANSRLIEKFRFDDVTPLKHRWRDVRELDDSLNKIGSELRTLAKYAPGELVSQWLRSGKPIATAPEIKTLDLLFSCSGDSQAVFSAHSSKQLNELLPKHFDSLANTIQDQRGTIDRFTGDGIRAFWGAPLAIDGGAQRACSSALLCVDAERRAAQGADESDSPLIRSNFAVHSGPALVGDFGSQQRLSYTAIGETVTIGAVLLRLNQRYGTRIIISGTSYRQINEAFHCRPLDVVKPSASGTILTIYELVADHSTQLPLKHRLFVDSYTLAFEHYLQQAWEQALEQLGSIPQSYRDDPSVRLLTSRCRALSDGSVPPPPKGWNGVYPEATQS